MATKERVRKYDDAGLHPEFAAHICDVGRFFADKSKLTAPLAKSFDNAKHAYLALASREKELRSA